MLAEARARLANTRGKKAKRKAREKQLEEARRLASLQKMRELKAAGIEQRPRDRRLRGGIDYNAEVAFEKKPAPGFYETGAEVRTAAEMQQEFRPTTVEEMEGKRRKDIEAALMKRDIKRQKLNEARNAPGLVARINEANAAALQRRTKMMLPAPQVSEAELEAIARMGDGGGLEAALAAAGAGGDATRQLLGEYSTPARFATPMRTPRATLGGQDSVMQQAANLAKLRELQTPLLGGDNPELVGMDYSGIAPQRTTAATPNPLAAAAAAAGATPARGPGATPAGPAVGGSAPGGGMLPGATPARAIAGVAATPAALAAAAGATPGRGVSMPGATPMRIRDELGLNEGAALEAAAASGSSRAARAAAAALREELRSGLAGLPAPENEYSVAMPEVPEEEAEAVLVEDAADVKARRAREIEAARAAEERKKSGALRRGLPRPVGTEGLPPPPAAEAAAALSLRERAEAQLYAELATLVQHDNITYPITTDKDERKSSKRDKKRGRDGDDSTKPHAPALPPLQQFDITELDEARLLLAEEVEVVRGAMGHAALADSDYATALEAARTEWLLDERGMPLRRASATPTQLLDALRRRHEAVRAEMEVQAHRAARLDKKASVLLTGLQQRHKKLRPQLEETAAQLTAAHVELESFRALQEQERRNAPDRVERMQALLDGQLEREAALQQQYRQLCQQRDDAREALTAARAASDSGLVAA